MKLLSYIIGTLLTFLIVGTVTMMVSGFILLDTWGKMEKYGVLRPAQGGNTSLIAASIWLLIGTFAVTFLYTRLKKAENPLIFGPIIGTIFSISNISSYYSYMIPTLKVPIYTTAQYIIGFTLGIWVFRKTYYRK